LHHASRIHAPKRVGLEFRVTGVILEDENPETRTLLYRHTCNFISIPATSFTRPK
jgi:hypothetical protein